MSVKNKKSAKEMTPNKITKYKFKKTKDRRSTPNKNPKQIE
jgi:hypothetical protein